MAGNPGAEAPKCHQVAACIVGFNCGNTIVWGALVGLQMMLGMGYQGVMGS